MKNKRSQTLEIDGKIYSLCYKNILLKGSSQWSSTCMNERLITLEIKLYKILSILDRCYGHSLAKFAPRSFLFSLVNISLMISIQESVGTLIFEDLI